MPVLWRADALAPTADADTGADASADDSRIPPDWPCAGLPGDPPSVADRQAAPSADDLLPQILALTPRGPAWGTDEAGDGRRASPVLLTFWRALSGWAADHLARDFEAATQTIPSAISYTLPDWETELGLPGPCAGGQAGRAVRIAAVRARYSGGNGPSPAYLVCLAEAAGYEVTIEEPEQFLIDVSACGGGDPVETWFYVDAGSGEGGILDTADLTETWFRVDEGACDDSPLEGFLLAALGEGDPLEALVLAPGGEDADEVAGGLVENFLVCDEGACDDTPIESFDFDPSGTVWKYWVVHVGPHTETWFRVDDGECAADPLEGFLPATDLECLLRAECPPHTQIVFDYASAA